MKVEEIRVSSPRKYYSVRIGKRGQQLSFDALKEQFLAIYRDLEDRGYLQQAFGYFCVDAGQVEGAAGNPNRYLLKRLRRSSVWPITAFASQDVGEDDLFDVIEFLWDHVSKPHGGIYHSYSNCGQHYDNSNTFFDSETAKAEYRDEVNVILGDYEGGYELSDAGEIVTLPEKGMEPLLLNRLPTLDPENVEGRVEAAVRKFRRYKSSPSERRGAVRDLADVFEFLRPQLKSVLSSKDEADLFNLANNFAIRHHNERQKSDYDQELWLPWMFYVYLATIHVATRLVARRGQGTEEPSVEAG